MLMSVLTLIAQSTAPPGGSNEVNLGGFTPPTESYSTADGLDSAVDQNALVNLENLISTIIGFITVLGALFFVVYFFIAAFQWITAGGDSGKLQKARDRMLHGLMGLIIIVASYSILGIIGGIIGLDVLNPAGMITEILQP